MTDVGGSGSIDITDPVKNLRNDELWEQYERDGSAKLMLEIARKQAQTTLALVNSEVKDVRTLRNSGAITVPDASRALYELRGKKRSTVAFLNLVEIRQAKLKARRRRDAISAIRKHRCQAAASDYEPTEFDRDLWSILEEEDN